MIIITGKIINKIPKEYTNKKNELIKEYALDLKDDDERFYNTVSMPIDKGEDLEVGEEISLQVKQYSGVTKNNTAYLINKFVNFVEIN